jgi:hypothetical protein
MAMSTSALNPKLKPRIYVETSVISYLTARPSRDLIVAAHQEVTRQWWEARRADFDLFASEAVRREAALGDALAAQRRLSLLQELRMVEIVPQALALANDIVVATALPASARVDALHIAVAACEALDFVLTWNFKHIANAELTTKVQQACQAHALNCPVLCTPLELMGAN